MSAKKETRMGYNSEKLGMMPNFKQAVRQKEPQKPSFKEEATPPPKGVWMRGLCPWRSTIAVPAPCLLSPTISSRNSSVGYTNAYGRQRIKKIQKLCWKPQIALGIKTLVLVASPEID